VELPPRDFGFERRGNPLFLSPTLQRLPLLDADPGGRVRPTPTEGDLHIPPSVFLSVSFRVFFPQPEGASSDFRDVARETEAQTYFLPRLSSSTLNPP